MVSVIKVMGLGINGTLPDIVGNVRLTVLEVEVHSDQAGPNLVPKTSPKREYESLSELKRYCLSCLYYF